MCAIASHELRSRQAEWGGGRWSGGDGKRSGEGRQAEWGEAGGVGGDSAISVAARDERRDGFSR